MSEEIKQAFERLRAAFESGDLFRLYEETQSFRQVVIVAVDADLARQDYEMHHDD